MFRPVKRLYDWVLHWAETPYGMPALCALSFAESSFFPIPPDPLLLALAVGRSEKALKFGFYCAVYSVLGGVFGYAIGLYLMDAVGFRILDFYGAMDKYDLVKELYQEHDAWAVAIAGFSPLPYKVFTIAAGAFDVNFVVFVLASAASRGARFMLEAGLVWKFGAPIKVFIDRYFNILTVIFLALTIGGFALLKFIL